MKPLGVVRKIDSLGRFVLPIEIRNQLDLTNDKDCLEVFMDGDKIVLKKYQPTCIFCDNITDFVLYKGKNVCTSCINKMSDFIN